MTDLGTPSTTRVEDGAETFDVSLLHAERPVCTVLFAVGAGGDPLRHLPLLQALARRGCTMIAPHFERLGSIIPTKAELDLRIRRLEAAVAACGEAGSPIVGIGHSIGTAALLALAGGEGETRACERLLSGSSLRFSRLALLSPPTGFFLRPGALREVRVPIRIWTGAEDPVTPPDQAWFLKAALAGQAPVDVEIGENAGHFTYMDEPPPMVPEPHPDRRAFLSALADDIAAFALP